MRGAVGWFFGPMMSGAANSPEALKAQRFELLDDSGKVRAELATTTDGSHSGLVLAEGGGEKLMLLLSTSGESGLFLTDKTGKPHLKLTSDGDNG